MSCTMMALSGYRKMEFRLPPRTTVIGVALIGLFATATGSPGGQWLAGTVVDNDTGRGIGDVEIQVLTSTGEAVGGATVDRTGRFRVENLGSGSYQVHLSKFGYVPMNANVTAISRRETWDGYVLRLIRGAVITGHVFDSDHQPVSGARVILFAGVGESQWKPFAATADADQNGEYRLYGLKPGTYRVGGLNLRAQGNTILGILPFQQEGQPIDLTVLGGEVLEHIDLSFPSEPLFTIEGSVSGPGGLYTVSLLSESGVLLSTQAVREGQFRFANTRQGAYSIVARSGTAGGTQPQFARATTVLGSSSVDGLQLTLHPAPESSVFLERSEDSCPPPIRLTLSPLDAGSGLSNINTVIPGQRPLSLGPLTPARYLVSAVSALGECENSAPTFLDYRQDLDHHTWSLTMRRTGTIRGSIKEVTHSSTLVVLVSLNPLRGAPIEVVQSGDDHRFVFARVVNGRYYLLARRINDLLSPWKPLASIDPSIIDVHAGAAVDLALSTPPRSLP